MTAAARGEASSVSLRASDIAAAVGGRLEGDGDVKVTRVAALDAADAASLSFFNASRYAADARQTAASAVLVTADLLECVQHVPARIVVAVPQVAMLAVLPLLYPRVTASPGVDPSAVVAASAHVADDATVGARAVIGASAIIGARTVIAAGVTIGEGVTIGADCVLHPNVTLYPGTMLGDRVQVHAGAVLGSDGFGYTVGAGAHQKIPHVGRCVIESDVEIGANTTIDRGSVGDTVIGAGTKIDNLVHLGHNVRVGKRCLMMAQVGVSGSTHIGDGVVIAGQAGLAGHIRIGDGARIAAQAGVFGDVPAGQTWSGYPARPHRVALRVLAASQRLPAILKSLRLMEDRT